jgi:molybdate transport system regulatory protein
MSQPDTSQNFSTPTWLKAELRLAGTLDNRLLVLLKAIDDCGSLNKAAKQVGLSYKGAWQIIEKANHLAPKVLVTTATGGSKGGGTYITEAGQALLVLFTQLKQQHDEFLKQLNASLATNPEMVLLLQRQVVKTTAHNQLFGIITAIHKGAVNTEINVKLKGGEQIIVSIAQAQVEELALAIHSDALLLLNSIDITLVTEFNEYKLVGQNRLLGTVIRIQQDAVNAEVIMQLPGGETLAAILTQRSLENLAITTGKQICAVFSSHTPILGIIPKIVF